MTDYLTEIITESDGELLGPMDADGWGEDAKKTNICGKPMQIQIYRDGKAQFSVRICDNGRLILTDYVGMHYEMNAPQNLTLRPSRPWEDATRTAIYKEKE